MTEMINALLLKYKRGTARPRLGASHRTVVVTLTYHHQQIIILGHTGHQLHHGKLWQDTRKKGGWMMLGWERWLVGGGKNFPMFVWLWLTYLNDIHFLNVCSIVFILLSTFKVKRANIISWAHLRTCRPHKTPNALKFDQPFSSSLSLTGCFVSENTTDGVLVL